MLYNEINKALARKNFLEFTKLMKPDYVVTRFNDYLTYKLQKFVEDVEANRDPFLIINVEPRSGKSALTSKLLPAYILGLHSNWEMMVACYNEDLAKEFVRDAAFYLKSPEYPFNTQIGDIDSATMFETSNKGRYMGAGAGGGFTGKGANILIVDDIFKSWQEAESEINREFVSNWYNSTFRTRKNPGQSGTLAVSTRWHEDDLIGKIIKTAENPLADQPEVIKFPAIAIEDEYLERDGKIFCFRKKGEVLQPERKDLKTILRDKASNPVNIWESVYQQDPTPAQGYIIQQEWFKFFTYNDIPQDLPVYSYSDTAYGVGKDNTVTIYGHVWNYNLYICHVKAGDLTLPNFLLENFENLNIPRNQLLIGNESSERFLDYRSVNLIEPKASGTSAVQLGYRYNLAPDKSKELSDSKVVRVKSVTGFLKAGRVYLLKNAIWVDPYILECTKFSETAKKKDQPDATAGFIRNFLIEPIEGDEAKSEFIETKDNISKEYYSGFNQEQSFYE